MAKRRRARSVSIDGLIGELKSLDIRRQQILSNIKSAVASVTDSWTPAGPQRRGRRPGATKATKGTRQRRIMSAAQRRAVSARMRKYWAARRKASSK